MKTLELLEWGKKELKKYKKKEIYAKQLIKDYLLIKEYKIILNEEIDKKQEKKYKKAIKLVTKNIPIQYIIGNVDFYNINLKINKNVLIPRFETEELVENTIYLIKKYFNSDLKILDIGTGSGAIALSLKREFKKSEIYASDISNKALKVAKNNANSLNLKINLIKSDIFEKIKTNNFDVIISNPPYIDENEKIEELVIKNEPNLALFAPNKGLKYYEEIIKESKKYLNEKSIIAFEIGEKQTKEIEKYVKIYYPKAKMLVKKDIYKRDRMLFILNNIE